MQCNGNGNETPSTVIGHRRRRRVNQRLFACLHCLHCPPPNTHEVYTAHTAHTALVHAATKGTCGHALGSDNVHDSPPARDGIAIHGIEEGLANDLKQLLWLLWCNIYVASI
jgi:hypothetical protein